MPTTERRRRFLERALRCFQAQTYTDCELLILEEAAAPLKRDWPARVRYEWMPDQRMFLGRKRNFVNTLASSELILHWDSDDWYAPERIARQVALLDTTGMQVTGLHAILYYREIDQSFWQYRYQRPPWSVGAALCYRRTWWETHRFPETMRWGEDTQFCQWSKGVMASEGLNGLMVAIAHDGNTYRSAFGQLAEFPPATREMFPQEFLHEMETPSSFEQL